MPSSLRINMRIAFKEDSLLKDVAAVVVTYNRKELLKECIDALLQSEKVLPDVLIIDNASTDGTWEYILEYIREDKVIYHRTEKNVGGAGGFHVGMKMALSLGYSYVWLMDDDTIVQRDTLQELMVANEKLEGNYGFLSSIAYWTDGSLCNMNFQRTGIKQLLTEKDYEEDYPAVIMATFVSFFVKADVIREVGLPIEEFFIWSDDLEYSRRISMQMPCYAVTKSRVLHKMGSNARVGIEVDSADRLWRYEYLYRNEVYVFRREGIKGMLYLLARVAMHCARIVFKGNDSKMKKLSTVLKSFFSGFSFHPEIKYMEEVE